MVSLQQGLRADGIHVSMAQLCRWFWVVVGEAAVHRGASGLTPMQMMAQWCSATVPSPETVRSV